MANYEILKAAIQNVVKTNGNNEITGALLQQSLLAMINSFGVGYMFMGVATPNTNPGTPDQNVFYLCGPGVYPNFGGIALGPWQLGILKYNGSWEQETIDVSGFVAVSEDGWFLVDELLNVAMKYDADGLDAAKVSDHFKSLIGGNEAINEVIINVLEDGFFLVDENLNIGVKVDGDGLDVAKISHHLDRIINGRNKVVRVAASDASDLSKLHADYQCTGANDQTTILNAINSLSGQGTVFLSEGTFYIDGFSQVDSTHFAAVPLSQTSTGNINIIGVQNTHGRFQQSRLKVKQSVYNALNTNAEYSIFRHTSVNIDRHINFENIIIEIYGNQKKIICFDGLWSGAINMYNCFGEITAHPASWGSAPPSGWEIPNEGCVFFRGTSMSQNWNCKIVLCSAYSFGIGFAVQGEHIYLESCVAACCNYGYAFNKFSSISSGAYCHPMILINCVDEMMHNYPSFGNNAFLQSVEIINYHAEHKPSWFALGGNYAKESTPGQWRGRINYALQMFGSPYNLQNSPSLPFWANDGSGQGFVSKNDAHKLLATTSERTAYAPNYGQQVYDTILNAQFLCVDPTNNTWIQIS